MIATDWTLTLRDAIKEDLNANLLPLNPEAVTAFVGYTPRDTELLQVMVGLVGVEFSHVDGGDINTDHCKIVVLARKRVEIHDTAQIDAVTNLMRAIQSRYDVDVKTATVSAQTAGVGGEITLTEKHTGPFYSQHLLDTTFYIQLATILIFRNWVDR